MKTGKSVPAAHDREGVRVRDDSHLRDIEELVAKLQRVTRQLELPARPVPAHPARGAVRRDETRSELAEGEMN